jgi:hypothetical protein
MWQNRWTPYGSKTSFQAHCPQLPVLPGENHFLVLPMSDVPSYLPVTCRDMRTRVAQTGTVSSVLFSLYVNDMPTSHHVQLALSADDTALMATSRSPSLIFNYLEAYLCRLEHWLRDWRMLFTRRRSQRPRPILFLGEPTASFETARYPGVNLDTRLTWSAHINQVRSKEAQRLGVLGPFLNGRCDLSIRKGTLLHKQLIRPVMDYACSVWRTANRSHIRKMQVLQSKCLRIATNAPWYFGNRQIHKDLGDSIFFFFLPTTLGH